MRRTLVTVVAAGAIGAAGFAVAGPALADTSTPAASAAAAVTSQVDRIRQALAGLVTDTADSNTHMRRINDALGYAPTHRALEYQLDL